MSATDGVPEADAADQRLVVDPDDDPGGPADPLAEDPLLEADPADVLDQRLPAPSGDPLARNPLIEADSADLAEQAAAVPYDEERPD